MKNNAQREPSSWCQYLFYSSFYELQFTFLDECISLTDNQENLNGTVLSNGQVHGKKFFALLQR